MRLTSIATKRIFETSRSCHTARPPHRPMWSASERRSRASFGQLLNSDCLIPIALDVYDARSLRRIHLLRSTPNSTRSEPHSVPLQHRHTERRESRIDVEDGQAYHGRTRTQTRQASSTSSANRSSRRDGADGG